MAEGKNIEIKIAATGGDQAAAEVRKVEDAAKSVTEATNDPNKSTGFGGMLDALPEKAEAATEKVEDLDKMVDKLVDDMGRVSEETEHFGNAVVETGKKADAAGPKLDKIANIERAQVAAALAEGLAKIGESVRKTAEDFAEADPQMSKTLTGVADGLDTVSSAANLAAQGFAVGGPFGAAIGALVGAALPELKSSLDDMVASLKAAAESEHAAAVAKANLNHILEMGADAYRDAVDAAEAYEEKTKELTESIDAQTAAMEKRNRVNRAKDSADAAERDVADAAEIRNGAPPEDVKSRRAQYDAEVAKRAVAEDLEAKRLAQTSAADKLLQANRNVEAVQNDPTITNKEREKKLEEEKRKKEAAQKTFDATQNDFEIARDIAEQKNRQIDAATTGKVEGLEYQKSERLKREKVAQDRKDKAADDQAEKERLEKEKEAAEGQLNKSARESGLKIRAAGLSGDSRPGSQGRRVGNGRRVGGKAPAGKPKGGNDTLAQIGKTLSDGTNAAEIQKLGDMVKEKQGELGAVTVATLQKMLSSLDSHTKQIEVLNGRIKNLRGR